MHINPHLTDDMVDDRRNSTSSTTLLPIYESDQPPCSEQPSSPQQPPSYHTSNDSESPVDLEADKEDPSGSDPVTSTDEVHVCELMSSIYSNPRTNLAKVEGLNAIRTQHRTPNLAFTFQIEPSLTLNLLYAGIQSSMVRYLQRSTSILPKLPNARGAFVRLVQSRRTMSKQA